MRGRKKAAELHTNLFLTSLNLAKGEIVVRASHQLDGGVGGSDGDKRRGLIIRRGRRRPPA